jgi:hypothetical protein
MPPPVARAVGLAAGLTIAGSCTPAQVRYQPVLPTGGPPSSIEATLYLVGDAGEVNDHSAAVLAHLRDDISSAVATGPARPLVVAFLGDNIYEIGARAEDEEVDLSILDAQVAALGSHPGVRGVFVPGNHDWSKGGADELGRTAVRLQQDWIGRLAPDIEVELLPADACPGPAGMDVGQSLRLIFIDTEWLLRQPQDDCGAPEAFYERLRLDLEQNRAKRVIVMSHHPLASGGAHSGHLAPFQNGPLAYYLVKKSGAWVQDLASPRYADMIGKLEEAFAASGTRPLLHAAGHDHTLQVIRLGGPGQPAYQLVSGAGSRSTPSRRIDGTRYATDGFGYMRLDFVAGDARLVVYACAVYGGPVRPVFACTLSPSAPEEECPEATLAEGAN